MKLATLACAVLVLGGIAYCQEPAHGTGLSQPSATQTGARQPVVSESTVTQPNVSQVIAPYVSGVGTPLPTVQRPYQPVAIDRNQPTLPVTPQCTPVQPKPKPITPPMHSAVDIGQQ